MLKIFKRVSKIIYKIESHDGQVGTSNEMLDRE